MIDVDELNVRQLIEEKRLSELRAQIIIYPVPDIADLLMELDKPNRVVLFRLLPRPLSSEVFSYL